MARLPRVTQKIFGINAPTGQVTEFGTIKDGSPQYSKSAEDIMNANYETGWSAAIDSDYAPYRQDRNAVDTAATQQLAYIFQEGLPEWDSGTTYYKGSLVKQISSNDVKLYKSLVDNNVSVLTDTTKWALFMTIDSSGNIVSPNVSGGTFSNPIFTGTVVVPTLSASDNSNKAASTSFVKSNLSGAISTVSDTNLDSDVVIVSNASGKIVSSDIMTTELECLSGITSSIQMQIDSKQPIVSGGATSIISSNLTSSRALVSNSSGKVAVSSVTSTELGYLSGTTSNVQTQINSTVKTSGNQNIAGVKTFTSSPVVPTPSAGDSSTKVANTEFVNSKINTKLTPKYTNRTTITSGYTASNSGIAYLTQRKGSVSTTISVDDVEILKMDGHTGSSHGQPRPCATVILGAGQTITFNNIDTAYFVPFS